MTLRWGIVSAGKISNDFVNALNSFPEKGDQVVAAIAARDKSRAAAFAKTHNIAKVFDTYEDLAKSDDIDVVYIGALNPDHYTLTKLFLDHGKHVLCEKPLTLNLKQTQSLVNLAKKKNLFLMETIRTHFSPAYIDLEKDLNAGKLGDVKFIEANFGIYAEVDRLYKIDQGGSAVLDVGIYLLHLAQYVFKDEPRSVVAVGSLFDTGVDEAVTIVLDYDRGRRAVLNTQTRLKTWNKATIYGEKGWITLEEPFHFPLTVTGGDGTTKKYKLHTSQLPYNYTNSAGLVYQTVEVARCIKAGLIESPRMPHKDTLMLAKLMDTVRKQLHLHYDTGNQETRTINIYNSNQTLEYCLKVRCHCKKNSAEE